jgi:hypothetical protein
MHLKVDLELIGGPHDKPTEATLHAQKIRPPAGEIQAAAEAELSAICAP